MMSREREEDSNCNCLSSSLTERGVIEFHVDYFSFCIISHIVTKRLYYNSTSYLFLGKWDEVLQFVSSFLHLGQPFPRNKLNGKGCHSYPHSLQRQDIRILDFL